jgi:hypothetical protein
MNKVLYEALSKEYWCIVEEAAFSGNFVDPDDTKINSHIHIFARHIQNLMHQK